MNKEYKLSSIPEVNKSYDLFHDGKIRKSRKYSTLITEVIPFDKIDLEILELWKEEVKTCYWLYAKETDFFIKGTIIVSPSIVEESYFVRTTDVGWFSIGFWGGRLEVDGSLNESIINNKYK